ncbi:MAG: calcium/sodium antiporter [Piscirickettsiaceae bacterium]|nr:calcium/sodium antiporter [Piscirickettsiaceae bacterium]
MTNIFYIFAIITGFMVLIWGADRFIDGAANIAINFGVPPLIIGLTIVGFGTSTPEILIATLAAIDGVSALGIGNALGSNIINIGMVLGITILIAPLSVGTKTINREFLVLALVMALSLFLLSDLSISYTDGFILLFGFVITLFGMAYLSIHGNKNNSFRQEYSQKKIKTYQAIINFVMGLTTLIIGSKFLVWGAVGIATLLGVSDLIIGLTIVAIGTSLPELVASIMSALKNEHDITIGNILGSNIFNLLAVLSMPGIIHPSTIDLAVIRRDYPFMIVLSIMLYLFFNIGDKGYMNRPAGLCLLLIYIVYNSVLAFQGIIGMSA